MTVTRPGWSRRATGLARGAAAVGLAAVLAGCGGASSGDPGAPAPGAAGITAAPEVVSRLQAMVPAELRSKGAITVAVTATYPPYEYLDTDGKTVIGQNADVMNEAVERLGLKINYVNVAEYGSLLTGIQAERFDAAIIFADTPEREKVVDMVSFYEDGVSIVGPSAGPHGDDIACGKAVQVAAGSLAAVQSAALNKSLCTDPGKPSMNITESANSDLQFIALTSGRAEFILTSLGVGAHMSNETAGKFAPLSQVFSPAPTGTAVSKKQPELSKALQAAIQSMVDDGSLKTVFAKWTNSTQIQQTVGINIAGQGAGAH